MRGGNSNKRLILLEALFLLTLLIVLIICVFHVYGELIADSWHNAISKVIAVVLGALAVVLIFRIFICGMMSDE